MGTSHQIRSRVFATEPDLEFRIGASENQSKLSKQLREFDGYIRNNQNYIPNYGERYRNGERIATSFVESTVNQVVSKRMAKNQQMAWTEQGVHLLLQVRTRVLNRELEETFRRWLPSFDGKNQLCWRQRPEPPDFGGLVYHQ